MIEEAVIVRCIRPDLKEMLLREVDYPELRALPKCGDGAAIGFAVLEDPSRLVKAPEGESEERISRKKRAPSDYNLFIGKCMRGPNGKPMKACSIRWKEEKGGRV